MKATLLLRDRQVLPSEDAVVGIVIWQPPRMLPGSRHRFKYRLARSLSAANVRCLTASLTWKGCCRISGRMWRFEGQSDEHCDNWRLEPWHHDRPRKGRFSR